MTEEQDWRLRGQEDYLQGATLVLTPYKAWTDDWEHDHCEFCWAKFMDATFSPDRNRFIREHPEVLTEGYAVQGCRPDESGSGLLGRIYTPDGVVEPKAPAPRPDAYWWVCPTCVADFAQRFEWTVVSDRDAQRVERRPEDQ